MIMKINNENENIKNIFLIKTTYVKSCFYTNIPHSKSSWIHVMENNINITYQLMRRKET